MRALAGSTLALGSPRTRRARLGRPRSRRTNALAFCAIYHRPEPAHLRARPRMHTYIVTHTHMVKRMQTLGSTDGTSGTAEASNDCSHIGDLGI